MEPRGRAVLQFFTLLTINGLHSSSQFQDTSLEYKTSNSKNPVILLIRSAYEARLLDEELIRGFSDRNHKPVEFKSVNNIFYTLKHEDYEDEALRTVKLNGIGSTEELEEELIAALRSGCGAQVKCENTCTNIQPTMCPPGVTDIECPETVPYCPKTCKVIFAECPGLSTEKKVRGHVGKTMPPKPDKPCN